MKCTRVFKERYVIPPIRFDVVNYPRNPVAVFNPGAVLVGETVHVFPRLVFDYYKYTSAIGHFILDWNDLLKGTIPDRIELEIVLWPKTKEEFLGCEDPRVIHREGTFWILYTGKGYRGEGEKYRVDHLIFAELDMNFSVLRKAFIKVERNGEEFFPVSNKDSAFVKIHEKGATVLTRPNFGGRLSGWRGYLDMERWVITDLEEVLPPEDGELKRGWSTNVVEVEGGYLVGWHAVLDEDLSYRNGFALVDESGNVLSKTGYVLCPEGLVEELGDRAMVVFGDGLVSRDGKLVWIGGASDYAVGVFIAELEEVLERIE